MDTSPMSVPTKNLMEEKNQEIDQLNQQLDRIRFEMAALKSGEAHGKVVEKERERGIKNSNVFRLSKLSDTDEYKPTTAENKTKSH